jgi:hypothetical protein
MATPRRLARPDRSADGRRRHSHARDLAGYADVRDFFRTQRLDGHVVDPGRLIETTFVGATPEDDAEVVLIAWLALLPREADVPAAAADLARHLAQKFPGPRSALQRRLLDLLAYIAAHMRTRDRPSSSDPKRKAKP